MPLVQMMTVGLYQTKPPPILEARLLVVGFHPCAHGDWDMQALGLGMMFFEQHVEKLEQQRHLRRVQLLASVMRPRSLTEETEVK